MKDQNFGIEIELTGITRKKAAEIMAEYFGTRASYEGGGYSTYFAKDQSGRVWKAMADGSIDVERDGESVEIVSPICKYEDIETIQEIVRLLRHAGAIANSSCGVHVHINAAPHNPTTLRNIVNIIASKEDLLYKAVKFNTNRIDYCQKTDYSFLNRLNNHPPRTLEQVKQLWYNGRDRSGLHYDPSRYHALNLHSVFSKGTIEFRLFNGTTHAGEIKAYIQLCLAISHQALTQRSARHTKTITDNDKYTFRTWLLRLGLIGDEFKTAREHLLKNLEGDIAWRDPAQREAQKQRLAERRQKEREQKLQEKGPVIQEIPAQEAAQPEPVQEIRMQGVM
jgi:hypothetical protein